MGHGAEPCQDATLIAGYLADASGRSGHAEALFRPESEADLAAVLRRASASGMPVTPVAARTSLTAGAVADGGWLLSLEKLTRFAGVDAEAASARAEPGVMLGALQREIESAGFLYPPDPTSRHECTLGGSVACNASGARSFRYGATRVWIRGLRVVLATGDVLALQRGDCAADAQGVFEVEGLDGEVRAVPGLAASPRVDVKNASGYLAGAGADLVDLFIGSEGTLGVISEIEVALVPLPQRVFGLLAFFDDEARALEAVERARAAGQGGGAVEPRCLEWFDAAALDLLRQAGASAPVTIPDVALAAVFSEQECRDEDLDEDRRAEAWLELLGECGALVDTPGGVLFARSEQERERLREARHAVPAGVNARAAANGMPKLGTDLAVPDAHAREMMDLYRHAGSDPRGLLSSTGLAELQARVDADPAAGPLPTTLETVAFGHIGDNHLHLNFLPTNPAGLWLAQAVYAQLTRSAIRFGGTPSAEHGIGKIKHEGLRAFVGDAGVASMRAIKQALDPAGVLSRGNLFPESHASEDEGFTR